MQISEIFKIAFLFLFIQCYTPPKIAGQFSDQEFEAMATEMAKGKVADITPQQLADFSEEVILLDTRERVEYDISHIPNAIWVGYNDFSKNRIKDLSKEATIITYCSVGYRSERIGEKLQKWGFDNVYNLKGSIFQWFNEKRPIIDKAGQPTNRIHGYNNRWGKWIKDGEVQY